MHADELRKMSEEGISRKEREANEWFARHTKEVSRLILEAAEDGTYEMSYVFDHQLDGYKKSAATRWAHDPHRNYLIEFDNYDTYRDMVIISWRSVGDIDA